MKRRQFIKQSSLASSALFVPQFMKAFDGQLSLQKSFKKLVVIQLSGGNDGLNTIVPFTNDLYYKKRPNLAVSKSNVIPLTDSLGINSDLRGFASLYHKGYVSIINNVGYPNPNRSHFRSTDIWHTASNANQYKTTGWLGRYLEQTGKKPFQGVEVDDALSLILKGENSNGIATKNPALLYRNITAPYFTEVLNSQDSAHLSEHNLGYLYKTMIDAKTSAKYLFETTKTYKNNAAYPSNPFAKQLKTIATFINSGVNTQVYYASMGGFDTHAGQLNKQSRLHKTFDGAITSFINNLKEEDTFKDTLVMVFSEFGRRVQENASKGTDHGTANQVFILGENLKRSGFYNQAPNLLSLDEQGDIKYEIDFREVYATLLNKWLDVNDKAILEGTYKPLNFI